MRLITLNCWGGKVFEPLMGFFQDHSKDTDIFCLQEILFGDEPRLNVHDTRNNLFDEIRSILSDFQVLILPSPSGSLFAGLDPHVPTGQAIFVRNGIRIEESGGLNTYDPQDPIASTKNITTTGHLQFVRLGTDTGTVFVGNLHGLWQPEGKVDTPARYRQSEILTQRLAKETGPVILCGDFNMLPSMETYHMLTDRMRDHVMENSIPTTRSILYSHIAKAPHSDYILTSPNMKIRDFEVLQDTVSDHLPLLLDFEA